MIFYRKALLNLVVDFRYRHFAFRSSSAEPPRHFVSAGSRLSRCSRRSLRAFHSNQQSISKSTLTFYTAYRKRKEKILVKERKFEHLSKMSQILNSTAKMDTISLKRKMESPLFEFDQLSTPPCIGSLREDEYKHISLKCW